MSGHWFATQHFFTTWAWGLSNCLSSALENPAKRCSKSKQKLDRFLTFFIRYVHSKAGPQRKGWSVRELKA